MEKLPICRICLVENVQMFVIANKKLQAIYEKLTDTPLLTEDRRPMLACSFCCNRLKQCCRFQRKCLEAEKLFARILNEEDYEVKPLLDQGHSEFSGYIISPTVHITISDECPAESGHVIKENIPVNREGQNGIVELKEEQQSDSEQEFQDTTFLDQEDLPPQLVSEDIRAHHSESDSEDDVPLTKIKSEVDEQQTEKPALISRLNFEDPLMEFKTEAEDEQEVSNKNRQAKKTTRAAGTKKPKQGRQRAKPKDKISTLQKRTEQADSKIHQNIKKTDTSLHTSGKPYKCEICQRSYGAMNSLKRHILLHTGKKPYKCDICQRGFNEKSPLIKHIRVHTGERPFKCDVCKKGFAEKGALGRHSRIHTGQKPHKCDICQRSFSVLSNLKTHVRLHSELAKHLKCDVCLRSFSDRSKLKSHMLVHTGEKKFKCEICQRLFSRKSTLKIHMRVHPPVCFPTDKLYKCESCPRSFSSNGNLSRHLKSHSDLKPYMCDYCQRNFRLKYELKSHIRVHTGEKPYKCELCQKYFNSSNSLRCHIRVHTSEKPYQCEVCARRFNEKGHLVRHARLHTGEKPYKCEICQWCFSDKSNLQKHVRLHELGRIL